MQEEQGICDLINNNPIKKKTEKIQKMSKNQTLTVHFAERGLVVRQLRPDSYRGLVSQFHVLRTGTLFDPDNYRDAPTKWCAEKQNIGKFIVLHAVNKMEETVVSRTSDVVLQEGASNYLKVLYLRGMVLSV